MRSHLKTDEGGLAHIPEWALPYLRRPGVNLFAANRAFKEYAEFEGDGLEKAVMWLNLTHDLGIAQQMEMEDLCDPNAER